MENRSGLGQAQDQARIGAEGINPTYLIGGGGGGGGVGSQTLHFRGLE